MVWWSSTPRPPAAGRRPRPTTYCSSGGVRVPPWSTSRYLVSLTEMDHGVVELLFRHRRLGERMCPLSPVGVEHEVEVTPPGVGCRGAGGVDDSAVGPDEVDDVGLCNIGARLAGFLGSGENVLDLSAHLVVDVLGVGVVGEAAGEKVVETSVSCLDRKSTR